MKVDRRNPKRVSCAGGACGRLSLGVASRGEKGVYVGGAGDSRCELAMSI